MGAETAGPGRKAALGCGVRSRASARRHRARSRTGPRHAEAAVAGARPHGVAGPGLVAAMQHPSGSWLPPGSPGNGLQLTEAASRKCRTGRGQRSQCEAARAVDRGRRSHRLGTSGRGVVGPRRPKVAGTAAAGVRVQQAWGRPCGRGRACRAYTQMPTACRLQREEEERRWRKKTTRGFIFERTR